MNNKIKVLLVEDEKVTHQAITRALTNSGYLCRGVTSLKEAHQIVKKEVFDFIICDIMLPDGTGLQLLETVRNFLFSVPFVVITASDRKSLIKEALEKGANDFLSKPFNLNNLPTVIERNVERKKIEDMKNSPKKASVLLKAIQALITALEAKDKFTSGHSLNVARYARLMGDALKLEENQLFTLELAAILHDIGKIGMPDNILKKSASLIEIEYKTAKEHTVIGSKIVGMIDELKEVAAIIRHHHERYDGTGYPDGLRGKVIPLLARVLAIVDTYESIVSERVYKAKKSSKAALQEILDNAGTQFDPDLVNVFLQVMQSDAVNNQPLLHFEQAPDIKSGAATDPVQTWNKSG